MTVLDSASQQRRARRVLLLIAGIPIAMMLAATMLWWMVEAGYVDAESRLGAANHGDLVTPPRSVSEMTFRHEGVAALLWSDLPAKWRLMVVQRGATCDDVCAQQLYQTRQIHLALGKEFNRVGRVLLGAVSPEAVHLVSGDHAQSAREAPLLLSEWLAREHQGLIPLTLPASTLDALLPESISVPTQWYIVDPAGWIMMSVSDALSYKDVISDLRFLLKHSGA